MRRFSILFFVVLLFSFCKKSGSEGGGAGSGDSAAAAYQTSAQIGAAGGTISDPNGSWTFTVPAGALSQTRTITVTTNATPVGAIPEEYDKTMPLLKFEPAGLTFLTPATLKVKYNQGAMAEGGIEEKSQKQYYINDDSSVTAMATTLNTSTNEVTAQVPHFTITGTLKTNITKVNSGAITRASTVRKIANNLITFFNNLGTDAARNAEFQLSANNAMLLTFINKLVQILGSDIFTAAFPNADFNGNGTINSLDPIAPVTGATVTLVSSGSLFVSTNPGAINSTQFVWRSSASGTYSIRRNGTNCTDGTVVQSGSVTLNIDNTHSPINASTLNAGDNEFRICVTAGPNTTFYLLVIARDEVYPVSAASPAGGTFTTAQNVSMTCLDTGDAGCAQIAYTTNGTDPTFDAAGNVTNGTLVTGMWLTPGGTSDVKILSRDEAGNCGPIISLNFSTPLSDSASVAADVAAASVTYSAGDSASSVTANLTLPTNGDQGSIITWVASYTVGGADASAIISPTGVVTQPVFGRGDTAITLTATATKGGASASASFALTVKANQGRKITGNGGFSGRGESIFLNFNGKLWIIAGVGNSGYLNDVWSSSDGVNWIEILADTASPGANQFSRRGWAIGLVHAGKMWVIGDYGGLNDVWSSSDGITWTNVLPNNPAPGLNQFPYDQYARCGVVFDNKMWIIGGGDTNSTWSSTDGINWTKELADSSTPGINQFTQRAFHRCEAFNGKIWVIGGKYSTLGMRNDVWSSPDGVVWTRVLADTTSPGSNQFTQRFRFGTAVFDNKLWIFGGGHMMNPDRNDVWVSSDGAMWTLVYANSGSPASNQFTQRRDHAVTVFDGKILLTGGSEVNYVADIWAH